MMRAARMRNPPWLLALPTAVCLADVALTLGGQPEVYWLGDYTKADEGNPLVRPFLAAHPSSFVGMIIAWVAFFSYVIRYAPRRWAVAACLVLVVGHTVGAASWLVGRWPG